MDMLPNEILLLIFDKLHCNTLKKLKSTSNKMYVISTYLIRKRSKRYIFYIKEIFYRSNKIISKLYYLNSKNIFIYNLLENIISTKRFSNLNRLVISMMSLNIFSNQ